MQTARRERHDIARLDVKALLLAEPTARPCIMVTLLSIRPFNLYYQAQPLFQMSDVRGWVTQRHFVTAMLLEVGGMSYR